MHVEHAQLALAGVAEAVHDADRRRGVAAGAGAEDLVADGELGFSFEDVEGVDVVGVGVRVDAFEVRAEASSITSNSGSSARIRW